MVAAFTESVAMIMIIPVIDLHLHGTLGIFNRPMTVFFHSLPGVDWPIGIAVGSALLFASGMCLFWAVGAIRWASRSVHRENGQLPSVSVIVAGRNEELHVESCLQSLVAQDYPAELLEIYFVNDNSTDATGLLAVHVAAGSRVPVTVQTAPPCPANFGPKKSALRFAIQQTHGEILLFTDADCVVRPGWVRALIECYDERTGAVTGAVIPGRCSGWHDLLGRLERVLIGYTSASAIGYGTPASASGGNFSYRRRIYDQMGGIAHSQVMSGDDDLMAQAIARLGWKVGFARGRDSVVEECRGPNIRTMASAAVRHQSTVKYYPVSWRIAYGLTILAGLGSVAATVTAILHPVLLVLLGVFMSFRLVVDGLGLSMLCHRLGVRVSVLDFLVAEFLLPLYTVLRPSLALMPSFTWHDRKHPTVSSTVTESAG
jgi:cellulose synthase/poly-beta-1,6-N-acetylglucosamine synthase-like glycosyltransferase